MKIGNANLKNLTLSGLEYTWIMTALDFLRKEAAGKAPQKPGGSRAPLEEAKLMALVGMCDLLLSRLEDELFEFYGPESQAQIQIDQSFLPLLFQALELLRDPEVRTFLAQNGPPERNGVWMESLKKWREELPDNKSIRSLQKKIAGE